MAKEAEGKGALGIFVRGLTKTFTWKEKTDSGCKETKTLVAVDGLDLEVDSKSIFCLLGHNGGESITMC